MCHTSAVGEEFVNLLSFKNGPNQLAELGRVCLRGELAMR